MNYTSRIFVSLLLFFAAAFFSGCGSVISQSTLSQVDRAVTLPMVQSDPGAYKDATVLWGGNIIETENKSGYTLIEVLERGLLVGDHPKQNGSSGRFLVKATGYLDPLVFKPSMDITVAGRVSGVEEKSIGEMLYPYPVLDAIEIFVSRPVRHLPPPHYLDPPYYGPYYPGHPPWPWQYTPWPGYPRRRY